MTSKSPKPDSKKMLFTKSLTEAEKMKQFAALPAESQHRIAGAFAGLAKAQGLTLNREAAQVAEGSTSKHKISAALVALRDDAALQATREAAHVAAGGTVTQCETCKQRTFSATADTPAEICICEATEAQILAMDDGGNPGAMMRYRDDPALVLPTDRTDPTEIDQDTGEGMQDQEQSARTIDWRDIVRLFKTGQPKWMKTLEEARPGSLYKRLVASTDSEGEPVPTDKRPGKLVIHVPPGANPVELEFVARVSLITHPESYNPSAEWPDLTLEEQASKKAEPRVIVYRSTTTSQTAHKSTQTLGIMLAEYCGEGAPSNQWGEFSCVGEDGEPFTVSQFNLTRFSGAKQGVTYDEESAWLQTIRQYNRQFFTAETFADAEHRVSERLSAMAEESAF